MKSGKGKWIQKESYIPPHCLKSFLKCHPMQCEVISYDMVFSLIFNFFFIIYASFFSIVYGLNVPYVMSVCLYFRDNGNTVTLQDGHIVGDLFLLKKEKKWKKACQSCQTNFLIFFFFFILNNYYSKRKRTYLFFFLTVVG